MSDPLQPSTHLYRPAPIPVYVALVIPPARTAHPANTPHLTNHRHAPATGDCDSANFRICLSAPARKNKQPFYLTVTRRKKQ